MNDVHLIEIYQFQVKFSRWGTGYPGYALANLFLSCRGCPLPISQFPFFFLCPNCIIEDPVTSHCNMYYPPYFLLQILVIIGWHPNKKEPTFDGNMLKLVICCSIYFRSSDIKLAAFPSIVLPVSQPLLKIVLSTGIIVFIIDDSYYHIFTQWVVLIKISLFWFCSTFFVSFHFPLYWWPPWLVVSPVAITVHALFSLLPKFIIACLLHRMKSSQWPLKVLLIYS